MTLADSPFLKSTRLASESKMDLNLGTLLPDVNVIALKNHFQDWCRQKHRNDFSILITGKTGVGKSSLVNALVGRTVAEQGHELDPQTLQVTSYCAKVIEGIEVRVWDSPGLQDGTDNEESYLADIKSKIEGELDLVIYCLKMDDTRFHEEDKKTIQILTQAFGKELWKNAVIALTFANKVEDPTGGDKLAFFLKRLGIWQQKLKTFFGTELQIDPELLQSLPLVPTGNYRQPAGLPNCGNWLSKFWSACYCVAKDSAAFNLYRINRDRVRFPGCEHLASVSGGSTEETETQTSPSAACTRTAGPSTRGDASQIPAIELSKEEQDSFWKTTWEMFKKHSSKASVFLGAIGTAASVGIAILKILK